MTHTPGPWTLANPRQTMGKWEQVQIRVGNDAICDVYPHGTATLKARNNRTVSARVLSAEDRANARLIAAAPDLLAVLKEFAAGRNAVAALPLEEAIALTERVRAAISKAEGV
jgi:hypothetical protein